MRPGGSITGHTDSFRDSGDLEMVNTNPGSLAYVQSYRNTSPSKQTKRESIYKAALLSQLKTTNMEECSKLSESGNDSQSEGTNSDDEEIMEEVPKKSRFGPKLN